MKFLAILAMCIGAAVVYGVAHDQITARVCVEYFTVAHPRVIDSESPTLLGFAWGFLATWWVGFFLGVPLAAICRAGPWKRIEPRDVAKPLLVVLTLMAVVALAAGIVGFRVGVPGPDRALWMRVMGQERFPRFSADAWAHSASYAAGTLGGFGLWIWALVRRIRAARGTAAAPTTNSN